MSYQEFQHRIAILGTRGIPARYGGFETLAHQLVLNLADKYDFTVYCSSEAYPDKKKTFETANLVYIPLKANGIQSIVYDIVSIVHSIREADILLILGVSGCVVLPFIKTFSRKRIVVHVDGIEWTRPKWNALAKWFLKFSERMAVSSADAVIADNVEIRNYLAHEYGNDSALIEYGGDHVETSRLDIIPDSPVLSPYAFTVCRIEPENNIHLLLEAFAEYKKLGFICVGNWDDSAYGRELKQKYRNIKGLWLSEPIYDQEALDTLRANCYCYIHGHSAGGTNPSLVEAMYLGLPIFAYDVSYNRATTENKASYFKTVDDLKKIIASIESQDRARVAKEMSEIASRRYKWEIISEKYDAIFQKSIFYSLPDSHEAYLKNFSSKHHSSLRSSLRSLKNLFFS